MSVVLAVAGVLSAVVVSLLSSFDSRSGQAVAGWLLAVVITSL